MGRPIDGRIARAEGVNPAYLATARLLAEVAPDVFASGLFALKGGTAINLFLRNMPRLSVDLDLVFIDHRMPRAEALLVISDALQAVRARLTKTSLQGPSGNSGR
jgi:hypothetical protein